MEQQKLINIIKQLRDYIANSDIADEDSDRLYQEHLALADSVLSGEWENEEFEANWECCYCEKDGLWDQKGMIEKSIFPNGDWSETNCWCNETCFRKWVRRQERKGRPLEEYAHYLKD